MPNAPYSKRYVQLLAICKNIHRGIRILCKNL